MATTYFDETQLLDMVFERFKDGNSPLWQQLVDRTENAIIDFAKTKGIFTATDIDTPLHFQLADWSRAYFYSSLAKIVVGINDISADERDKYAMKGSMYSSEMKALEPKITKEMINGSSDTRGDRSATTLLYRS